MVHICQFCSRNCFNAGGKGAHEKACASNPNSRIAIFRSQPKYPGGRGHGATLEKETERIRKITAAARKNNGGHRPGSGRGKKGKYKGFYCDSSYELAFLIYCLDHGKDISRNISHRKYMWEGRERIYIPDFIVDDIVIEIKGYRTKQWEEKLKYNPDITVYYEKDLKNVFDYVINKYGKDYIRLYENI